MALSKIDVANMVTGLVPNDNTIRRPNAKPIIINGDMAVAQRSTSVTGHSAVSYTTVDRFKTVCETGTYTVIQESLTSGDAYLAGFKNALRLDTTTAEATAGSAGEQTTIEQRIEGQNLQAFKKGTSNAEKYTLAFWVKASKTGSNLQVNLRDGDNSRQIGGTYSISSADTWEHKVVNYAADTTGAFGDDNGRSLEIEWTLDSGSNFTSGAIPTAWEATADVDRNVNNLDVGGSTSNDWSITGIQLEVGEFNSSTLPPFQHESFGANLARCQRYAYEVVSNESAAGNAPIGVGGAQYNSGQMQFSITFPVPMRTNPSLTCSSASNNYQFIRNDAADNFDDFVIDKANSNMAECKNSTDMSGTAGHSGVVRTANSSLSVLFTAEL